MSSPPARERDPWLRWDVLTTPMVEDEARQVVEFIEKHVSNVDAGVQRPGQSVRLVWDRDSVVMIRDGLPALRASGGLVYQGMIDDLDYWLMNVAEPRTPES